MNQTQQTQQSVQVSQEELAKTQVLNLTDVQEIANFEKKTSKRPAVLFAIAGILAITLGVSYPNIMTAVDSISSTSTTEPVEIIYTDNVLNNIQPKDLTCNLTSPNNSDGTSGAVSYKFILDKEDKVQRYTMTLSFAPQAGNAAGLVAVQNYYNQYRQLDVLPLEGYTTATTYTDAGMQTIISVDLTKFNKATLTPTHNALYFALVQDNLGDTKEILTQKYSSMGYVCE